MQNSTAKPCSCLVIDATLALDNPLRFRYGLLERIQNLIMTIDDKIRDEKLQYKITKKAAKLAALSSKKIDKYEYLAGDDILPSNQRQIMEQANFVYYSLGKTFEKHTKIIEMKKKKK